MKAPVTFARANRSCSRMPELAEVEFYRRQWNPGLGRRVGAVHLHPRARVFRGCAVRAMARGLTGATLRSSAAAAKRMLFRFSGDRWLGLHLGMSGEMRREAARYVPQKHDHLVLGQRSHCLVFTDPRMFGRVFFSTGGAPPAWWTRLAPPILSPAFTVDAVASFLRRRARTPVKAVLLMQERFPGIGNWMADEILWRAAIHPRRLAGSLTPAEGRDVWRECRRVCRLALRAIAGHGDDVPPSLNVRIPDSWLFNHRWEDGGRCPRTGARLVREAIGGRTTCWSPGRQKPPG
jgi:formamidopyrimidine-DNA glycosylase